MSEPLKVPIATIPKNSREEVRVSLAEFKGAQFVDLRVFAAFEEKTQARSPTKAGLTVSFANLPAMVRALQAAETTARAMGLLEVTE